MVCSKIETLGLKRLFDRAGPMHTFLLKVLTLPYLPAAHIPVAFTMLQVMSWKIY